MFGFRDPNADRPMLEPSPLGGFVVTYPRCGQAMLTEVRQYQANLPNHAPGWGSRFDYLGDGACRLHVYPLSDLPSLVVSAHGQRRYGT